MRAALIRDGGLFDFADIVAPEPGEAELLLAVTSCGLCGSDLKARGAMPSGTIMGHEIGGRVIEVGAAVKGWSEGDQAAVLPVGSCGACSWCHRGLVAHCEEAEFIGLGGAAGGFAELVAIPASSAFNLPRGLDPMIAALVEPLAVGLHCAHAAQIERGHDVLVIGAGTIGVTAIAWASQLGARRITAVDPRAQRWPLAEAYGATDTLSDASKADTGTYDAVVECVGRPGLLDDAVAAVRPTGRIVVAGVCAEPDPLWSPAALLKEVSIDFAVYYRPSEFRSVVGAFASRRINPAGLVGRAHRLSELDDAFEALSCGSVNGKILVAPS